MKKTLIATMLFSFLNVGFALAQTHTQDGKAPQPRYQSTTRYDFDNEEVQGSLQRPDGDAVDGIKKAQKSSLLKIRQHFQPEMLKSVEGL